VAAGEAALRAPEEQVGQDPAHEPASVGGDRAGELEVEGEELLVQHRGRTRQPYAISRQKANNGAPQLIHNPRTRNEQDKTDLV